MLAERDIDELAAKITGGAQEAFVAGLTAALIDDLMAGVVNAAARSTLGALAAENREHVDTLLMEHRAKISETVMAEVRRTLLAADERDAEAIATFRHSSPKGATRHAWMMAEQAAVGIRQMVERQNVALARQAEEAWYAVAAEGIRYAEAGAMPKGWVGKAVVRLADAGVKTVDYRSGTGSQVNVAIKRHMRTQVNQAAGRMEIDRLDACGHRFVQTTAHFGARPEHAGWQGKAFCLDGACDVDGVYYPDFYASTGYGTVTGLCGANCRHHFGIHFPSLSKLPELPETVNGMGAEEYYEATQRQRELERRVRKTKREISALERAGLGLESPAYVQKRLVLGRQQAALRSHCKEKGLVRQYAREKAYGVGSQPRPLSRKPAIKARSKRQLKSGRYAVTQAEIEAVIARDLPNVKLPCEISYNPRLRSYGATRYEEVFPGYNRLIKIEVGPQKDGSDAELRDTILHEILEARIIVRAGRLYEGGDAAVHPHIDRVIAKYVKMKGLK